MPAGHPRRPSIARFALGAALGCIFLATLTPFPEARQPEFVGCVVCGVRGAADALVNLILFVPLGAALVMNGRGGLRAVGVAGILSACIELAQLFIPGRDPSLGDVCFNTLGAAVGQVTALFLARWALPSTRAAARLAVAAACGVAAIVGLTGWLLSPALPRSDFRAWYTANRADMEFYRGRVLRTSLGSIPLVPSDLPNPVEVRRLLLAGAPLRILAVAGPRVRALSPLFVIEARWGDELFLIGPDRDDLALRYRTRATTLRLDQPDLRLRHALRGVAAGDTLRIEAHRDRDGYCLEVNQARACRLGFTIGSGWALLLYLRHFPLPAQQLLGAAWVGGLTLLVGFWARRHWETVLAGVLLIGTLAVGPHLVGLIPTPALQWLGAVTGLGIGLVLHALARRAGVDPRVSATGE